MLPGSLANSQPVKGYSRIVWLLAQPRYLLFEAGVLQLLLSLPSCCRVWYKHRDNYFLPTYAELTSMAIVRAANTAYESVIFSSIV